MPHTTTQDSPTDYHVRLYSTSLDAFLFGVVQAHSHTEALNRMARAAPGDDWTVWTTRELSPEKSAILSREMVGAAR